MGSTNRLDDLGELVHVFNSESDSGPGDSELFPETKVENPCRPSCGAPESSCQFLAFHSLFVRKFENFLGFFGKRRDHIPDLRTLGIDEAYGAPSNLHSIFDKYFDADVSDATRPLALRT
jgi:hypothetical protein